MNNSLPAAFNYAGWRAPCMGLLLAVPVQGRANNY
jgi:hypothetical protein